MITAADYRPPRWLRNPHLQSVLGSSALRRRRGLRALLGSGAVTVEHIVDGGDDVRLQGFLSRIPDRAPRGLVLLLHGWEGSADSSYMRLTAAQLLRRGFDVFRLNFRDHGDTHHLNPGIFHSNRIDEVVQAAGDIARRWPQLPLVAAGYSLGGNFVLRLALHAPHALAVQKDADRHPLGREVSLRQQGQVVLTPIGAALGADAVHDLPAKAALFELHMLQKTLLQSQHQRLRIEGIESGDRGRRSGCGWVHGYERWPGIEPFGVSVVNFRVIPAL